MLLAIAVWYTSLTFLFETLNNVSPLVPDGKITIGIARVLMLCGFLTLIVFSRIWMLKEDSLLPPRS